MSAKHPLGRQIASQLNLRLENVWNEKRAIPRPFPFAASMWISACQALDDRPLTASPAANSRRGLGSFLQVYRGIPYRGTRSPGVRTSHRTCYSYFAPYIIRVYQPCGEARSARAGSSPQARHGENARPSPSARRGVINRAQSAACAGLQKTVDERAQPWLGFFVVLRHFCWLLYVGTGRRETRNSRRPPFE